jgi:hypothetical protein
VDKARVKQGVRVHRPDLPGDPYGTITRKPLSGRWYIRWDHGQETAFDPDGDIEVELVPKAAEKKE